MTEGKMKALVRASLVAAIGAGLLSTQVGPVQAAAQCQKFGGWGTGALESFASFMAEAAMKNSAKAKFGDAVKIGAVEKKCEVKTLLYECTARARACK
jgi:hypothetical protein